MLLITLLCSRGMSSQLAAGRAVSTVNISLASRLVLHFMTIKIQYLLAIRTCFWCKSFARRMATYPQDESQFIDIGGECILAV